MAALLAVGAVGAFLVGRPRTGPSPQVAPMGNEAAPGALPTQAIFMEGPPSIRWILRGSQLLVNGKWVLNPATGNFMALPYATVQAVPGGGWELLGLSLSAEGDRVVVWTARELRFGPVNAALSEPVGIPLLNPRLTEASEQPEEPAQVLFWSSEQLLVLFQFNRGRDSEPQCARFDTLERQWKPLVHCPEGDFLEITQIDPGPEGWLAIHSESEGSSLLRIARYEPEQGQHDPPILSFDVSPMGFIQTQFSLDGRRIDFATTCFLNRQQEPCEDQGDDERGLLFSWRTDEEKLVLIREDLPPRAIPAPGGEQVAWLTANQVCISATAASERKACFCLPTASPGTCKSQ